MLRMDYQEIIAGLSSLQASDFDYANTDARGWEKLSQLTGALMSSQGPERAIPELFSVMERLPDADLGTPGPLVHTLEQLQGYEKELVRSVGRRPSQLSVWMVNRILNTELSDDDRRTYMSLLAGAAANPNALKSVRDDARNFIKFQRHKGDDSPNT